MISNLCGWYCFDMIENKFMKYRHIVNQTNPINIHSLLHEYIKVVDNFIYLGAWMSSPSKYFEILKALAWQVCWKLKTHWLNRNLKITFHVIIETILLYDSGTWIIDKTIERRINGCYTRLLRMILNVPWPEQMNNIKLYKNISKCTDVITNRRLILYIIDTIKRDIDKK